jgi:hypothetical protein
MTLTAIAVMFALSQKAQTPPKQTIIFGDEEILADRKEPDVEYTTARPPTKFPNLIKIRQNFADKIVKSVDQM